MKFPTRTLLGTALRECVTRAAPGWAGTGLRNTLRADRPPPPQGQPGSARGSHVREAVLGYVMVIVTLIGNGLLFPPRRRAQRGGR